MSSACSPANKVQNAGAEPTGVACKQDTDCSGSSTPCRTIRCEEGRCRQELARPGISPEQVQKSGDCQRLLCGVGGELITREDPADIPVDDGNPCTRELCSGGVPGRLPMAVGSSCGVGVCTASSVCVGLEEIAVGRYHGCLRLGDSSVQCWGAGERGQIGSDEEIDSRDAPTPIPEIKGARALALGGSHSCALLQQGAVCWGANEQGQLGDGSVEDRRYPVPVQGLHGITAIATGLDTSCAIAQGAVFCWGLGIFGQLGDGKKQNSSLPSRVSLPARSPVPRQISVGGAHACVLLEGGQVRCWGANDHGQLGDGTTHEQKTPTIVAGLGNTKQVAAGRNHTCALWEDGTVWCWGWNNDGQLGAGERQDASRPVKATGLSGVVELAAGNSHNCARTAAGKVYCWGWNQYGQVGNAIVGDALEPTEIESPKDILQLALGSKHSCARLKSGTFSCWGDNSRRQLGILQE